MLKDLMSLTMIAACFVLPGLAQKSPEKWHANPAARPNALAPMPSLDPGAPVNDLLDEATLRYLR